MRSKNLYFIYLISKVIEKDKNKLQKNILDMNIFRDYFIYKNRKIGVFSEYI